MFKKNNFRSIYFILFSLISFTGISQTILWQNDFSNTANWSISNSTADNQNWVITTINSTLIPWNTGTWVENNITVSNENGYALFDSDGIGVQGGSQDAFVTAVTPINLSGQPNVGIEFAQRIKKYYNTQTFIEVSNNGGASWSSFPVNVDKLFNTTYEEIMSVNISIDLITGLPAAGGQASVLIRFRFVGEWEYGWMVDDVKIKTIPNYDLILNNLSWGSTGASGIKIPYYKIPTSQIAPIQTSGSVTNYGSQNQSNVILNVNTTGFSGNSTGTTVNSGITNTLVCPSFTPPGIGTYNLNATVSSPFLDAVPSNNTLSNVASIEVNNNIYARDNGNYTGVISNGGNGFPYEIGNKFDIFQNQTLTGIRFHVHNATTAGAEVVVKLYSVDSSTGDFIWEGESNVHVISASEINTNVIVPLMSPLLLNANNTYLAVVNSVSGSFITSTTGTPPPLSSYFYNTTNGTWCVSNQTPAVQMVMCGSNAINQILNETACNSYVSQTGQTYNQSGSYTETISDSLGCDSLIVTINLTIINPVQNIINQTICSGDTYTWNNQDYTIAGSFIQTFTAANGCDSIVTLNLTVNENDPILIQANPTFGNAPLNVAFNNQTSNLSNYNFTWYFGDGSSLQSNSPFLSHTYTQDAYSDVTVVAQNLTSGCVTSNVFNDMVFVIGGVTCTHTATLNQTGPLNGCAGDSVLLSCNTDPSFSYQWNRNGIPVSGATSSSFYANLSGSYTVTIYQNNCPVTSGGISLTINPLPSTPTVTSTGTITSCSGGSLTLSAPSGFTSYSWNTGETTSSIIVTQSGSYTVTVTNANGCSKASAPYIVNASFLQSPNICVVGLDSMTNQNRIVWEKPSTSGIDSFYVYKESNVSDVYSKIGATDYPDLAVFLDQNSNPAVQAYRYKLTVLDTCGTETPLSDFHKTIHLTINAGVGGAWNLIWSHYEGLSFGSYNIYRGTDPTNISLLTTIQSNLNSYTDIAPPVGPVYYQIEIVNPTNCDPAKVINYSVSRSNIVNNGVNGINTLANNTIQIYPNPTSKEVTLEITADMLYKEYFLTDNTGRIILNGQIKTLKETINLEQVAMGVYFIKIDNNLNSLYRVVKN